jgi:hypothetical protein
LSSEIRSVKEHQNIVNGENEQYMHNLSVDTWVIIRYFLALANEQKSRFLMNSFSHVDNFETKTQTI